MKALEFPISRTKEDPEFNASETRRILQELFPTRKLVLSQFTFFNQVGVSRPSGESYRRGRRCYRAQDLLPIAVVLALKEQGIPNKNISSVPALIQDYCQTIFDLGPGSRISGFRDTVGINLVSNLGEDIALTAMLESIDINHAEQNLYWSFDVGALAQEISTIITKLYVAGDLNTNEVQINHQLKAVA